MGSHIFSILLGQKIQVGRDWLVLTKVSVHVRMTKLKGFIR